LLTVQLDQLLPLAQLLVGLLLILVGRGLVRFGAFVAAGSLGAYLIWFLIGRSLGEVASLALLVLGFVGFGLLGLLLLRVGVGVASGVLAYLIASGLGLHWFYALAASLVSLAVALLWHKQALAVLSVTVGALLVQRGLSWHQMDPGIVVMIVAALVALGLTVQLRPRR